MPSEREEQARKIFRLIEQREKMLEWAFFGGILFGLAVVVAGIGWLFDWIVVAGGFLLFGGGMFVLGLLGLGWASLEIRVRIRGFEKRFGG